MIKTLLAVSGFILLFSNCAKEDTPWSHYQKVTGGDSTGTVIDRNYILDDAKLSATDFDHGQVKVPVSVDTLISISAGKADTDTVASGFVDCYGDTAFITHAFWMDTAEVTKAQWQDVMTDSTDTLPKAWPKTLVSWFDAVRYCNAKSKKDGFDTCYNTLNWQPDAYPYAGPEVNWNANGYRLPTEDEWEYAAQCGAYGYKYPTVDGTLTIANANYGRIADTVGAFFNIYRYDDPVTYWLRPKNVLFYKNSIADSHTVTYNRSSEADDQAFTQTGAKIYRYAFAFDSTADTVIEAHTIDTNTRDSIKGKEYSREIDGTTYYFQDWYYTEKIFSHLNSDPTVRDTIVNTWRLDAASGSQVPQGKISYSDTLNRKIYILADTQNSGRLVVKTTRKIRDSILVDKSTIIKGNIPPYKYFPTYSFSVVTKTVSRILGDYRLLALDSVGRYPSSPFHLNNMCGNAAEWCQDKFLDIRRGFRVDYRSPGNEGQRVRRGGDVTNDGSGATTSAFLQSSARSNFSPAGRTEGLGFRTVRKAQ